MARYRIEPYGVEAVVKDVSRFAEHGLQRDAKKVAAAVEAADGHIDSLSPVRGMLGPFGLAVEGQIQGVASATTTVLSAAVNATNAYVEGDLEMARRGEHGVAVTSTSVSGLEGDRAQRGAERAVGGLAMLPKQDAMGARERPSLADWAKAVDQRQG